MSVRLSLRFQENRDNLGPYLQVDCDTHPVARRNAPSFSSILIKNQTLVTSNLLSIMPVFDADSEKIVQKIFGGLIA